MIYGQLAKQYGANNYKVVSESDAILEYMFSEAKQYQNLVLTESFFDDEERLVMEAKMEILQEAISGAIIAAIIAALAAIAGLIVLIIKLVKKGKEKLKEKAGDVSDISDEQKKELEEKIKAHAETAKWSNANKEKLVNFCDYDFTNSETISMMRNIIRSVISQIGPLSSLSSSSSTDNLKSIVNSFYDNIKKDHEEYEDAGWYKMEKGKEEGFNVFSDIYERTSMSGGPVAARSAVNKFMQSNYFDRSETEQKKMKEDIDKISKFLDENKDKIQSATQTKDKDSDYTDASNKLNEGLKLLKGILDTYKDIIRQWTQLETFRMKYCSIVMSYNKNSGGDKDKKKKDKKEDNEN